MDMVGSLRTGSVGQNMSAQATESSRLVFRFMFLSVVWILLSDYVVQHIHLSWSHIDPTDIQTIKAIMYIGLTGAFIFSVLHRYNARAADHDITTAQLFQACKYPMFVLDPGSLTILEVNDAAMQRYSTFRKDMTGKKFSFFEQEELVIDEQAESWESLKKKTGNDRRIFSEKITWKNQLCLLVHILESPIEIQEDGTLKLDQATVKQFEKTIALLERRIEELTFAKKEADMLNIELINVNEQLQDVNKRFSQRANEAIREKENLLHEIVDTVNDVVWSFDVGRVDFEYLSYSVERLFEAPYAKLRNSMDFWETYMHPEDTAVIGLRKQAVLNETTADFTYRIITGSGKVRWLYDRIKMDRDGEGNLIKVKGVTSDITYVKETEEIIRKTQLDLESVFNNISENFVIFDAAGSITNANAVAQREDRLFNQHPRLGSTFMDILCDEARPILRRSLDTVLKTFQSVKREVYCSCNDGRKWYEYSLIPVFDGEKKVERICFVARNITEKKSISIALEKATDNLDTLLNNTRDVLWSMDVNGKMIIRNRAAMNFFRAELGVELRPGASLPDAEPFGKKWMTGFQLALKGTKARLPGEFLNVKGEKRYFEAYLNPVTKDDQIVAVACSLQDVTLNRAALRQSIELNRRYNLVSQATSEAIWKWEKKKDRIWWNRGLTRTTCLASGSIANLSQWKEHVHPDDRGEVEKSLSDAIATGQQNWQCRFRFRVQSGDYLHILSRAYISYFNDDVDSIVGSMQDITAQVLAEKAVLQSAERYRLALRATGDAIYDHNLSTNVVEYGERYAELFGYAVTNESGDEWMSRIHPEDIDRVRRSWEIFIEGKGNDKWWREEYRYLRSDGRYAHVRDRGFLVYDENQNVARLFGAVTDITEQVTSTSLVKKLSLVAQKTNNMIVMCRGDFTIEWTNAAFLNTFDVGWENVSNINLREFLLSRSLNPFAVERLSGSLEIGHPASEELCISLAPERELWLRVDASPTKSDSGELENIIVMFSNVTAQKAYENRIIAIARELSNVIENASAVIFGIDRNGYINEWNHITAHVTGYYRNEVLGKKLHDCFRLGARAADAAGYLERALEGHAVTNVEFSLTNKNDKPVSLLISLTPRRDPSGAITGVLVVGQDITELTEYRAALERKVDERTRELNISLQKEKELIDMRRRFVSIASHEFRTPLSTIKFAAAYLKRYKDRVGETERQQKLETIDTQVTQMNYLLEDFLTHEKTQSGKILPKAEAVRVESFLTQVGSEVGALYGNTHRVVLNWSCSRDLVLSADPNLLRNIFINLIGNAIKFSPDQNEITVGITTNGSSTIFTVEDRGIGIEETDVARIFEPFHRGGNVADIAGTGLGLSIVRSAVDLMKGTIEVKSRRGAGTTFIVSVPYHI